MGFEDTLGMEGVEFFFFLILNISFLVFSARAASSLLYLVRKPKPHTCQ